MLHVKGGVLPVGCTHHSLEKYGTYEQPRSFALYNIQQYVKGKDEVYQDILGFF